jgi:pantoate kinase
MSKPMSQATIEIVKSTASVMQTYGVAITTRMYERLFRDPEMEALFEINPAVSRHGSLLPSSRSHKMRTNSKTWLYRSSAFPRVT